MARAQRSTGASGAERTLHSSQDAGVVEGSAPPAVADAAITVTLVNGCKFCPSSGTADGRIDEICAAQRARCSRRQLLAAGVGRRTIDRRIARGSLVPVHA